MGSSLNYQINEGKNSCILIFLYSSNFPTLRIVVQYSFYGAGQWCTAASRQPLDSNGK